MMSGSPTHFDFPGKRIDSAPPCKLLDVTLRDGGFVVGFQWPQGFPRDISLQLSRLDVEAVELGYIGGLPERHGVAAAGTAADLTPDAIEDCRPSGCRLAAMVHPSAIVRSIDFNAFHAAGLELVRFVYHESWRSALTKLARDAVEAGLRVSVNVALASRYDHASLKRETEYIWAEVDPHILYIADTCGALFPDDVTRMISGLLDRQLTGAVGFHAHDFMSLALANSIAAVKAGAAYVDGSVAGLGRSGGNLRTELWLIAGARERLNPGALARVLKLVDEVHAHDADPFFAALCGAMNLTPPEEDLLHRVASDRGVEPRRVALALASLNDVGGVRMTEALVFEALDRGDW